MQYHYLLIGLEELQLGGTQKLTRDQLLEEIRENLSKSDMKLLDEVLLSKDDSRIDAYLAEHEDLLEESGMKEDDLRTLLVYELGAKSRNRFVREWFAFNLDLNNVLTAAICRKHGYDIRKNVLGGEDNEVAEALRTSTAKDFGLAAALPEVADMLRIAEVDNLMERERQIDALRWQWLEETTLFDDFTVENVLAYWLRSEILRRWEVLTVEEGERVFREILADMKRGVKFEA